MQRYESFECPASPDFSWNDAIATGTILPIDPSTAEEAGFHVPLAVTDFVYFLWIQPSDHERNIGITPDARALNFMSQLYYSARLIMPSPVPPATAALAPIDNCLTDTIVCYPVLQRITATHYIAAFVPVHLRAVYDAPDQTPFSFVAYLPQEIQE